MTKRKILVIDDECDILDIMDVVLTEAGFDVEKSDNSSKAISQIARNHYDLVITDLNMPGKGGLEIIDSLRRKNTKTPVLLCSGSLTDEILAEVGEENTLKKPFQYEELMMTINKIFKSQ